MSTHPFSRLRRYTVDAVHGAWLYCFAFLGLEFQASEVLGCSPAPAFPKPSTLDHEPQSSEFRVAGLALDRAWSDREPQEGARIRWFKGLGFPYGLLVV